MTEAEDSLAELRFPRPDRAPIYDWARRHVQLPESYATPGVFNVRLSPWLIPIFDALKDPLIRRVHFRKAVQIGGTLVADVWLPWIIANDPGPISWTMQTDDMVERHGKTRLWPLLERCRPVAEMLPKPGPHRTTTEIFFGGFFLTLNAANLSTQQSQSIRYKINDEIWLPRWQEVYGHAIARVSKFEEVGRSKVYNVSQACVMDEQTGNVEHASYVGGNQQEWHADCPSCRKPHPITFDQSVGDQRAGVVWDREAKRDDNSWDVARAVASTRFRCVHCGHESSDSDATREAWKKTGRFIATRTDAQPENVSFRIEAVVARPMKFLVEEFLEAENHSLRTGDDQMRVDFRTKREAKPWLVVKKTINLFQATQADYSSQQYTAGQKIDNEVIRFMALDRQLDHWWVEIGAFSTATGPRYRQLWFGRVDTRDHLREIQRRYAVPDSCVAQDRGYRPSDVDRDCAEFGWRGMRGYGRKTWTMRDEHTDQLINFPFSEPRVSDYRGGDVYFYEWSGDYFKDTLAAALDGKGDLKWELPSDVNPLYVEHLKGESKVEVRTGVWEWREVRSNAPNHGLDTSAMLLCMATIAGVIRYTPPKKD
jgi:hypothetical protein